MLLLGLAAAASGQEKKDDPMLLSWAVDAPLGGAAGPRLPGAEHELGISLWLPGRPAGAIRGIPHADALFRAAAIYFAPEPTCVFFLHGTLPADGHQPLRSEEATLLLPGEKVVGSTFKGLGDHAPGRIGLIRHGQITVHYVISFPALAPDVSEIVLRVPVDAPDVAPLHVKLFRWKERLARAEAALAAWRAHCQKPEVQVMSATSAYTDCQGAKDLLACGEPAAVPLMLRELERSADGDAVPLFALLEVLSGTGWGHAERVASSGDPAYARKVARRWRETRNPTAPGVAPRR